MSREIRKNPVLGLSNLTLSLVVLAVFLVAVVAVVLAARSGGDAPAGAAGPAPAVVREDSHRLSTAPGARVTFVEFLDFECEACGAAHPAVEELRERYRDRVDFVVRYFPVPSHYNAERAARAVEAAAQQGRFEPMYQRMFATQREWGEQQVPMDDRFRAYAAALGLDLARFDAAYADPAVLERIRSDRTDGLALGVQRTPTFFVNDRKVEVSSGDDLVRAIDDALAGR